MRQLLDRRKLIRERRQSLTDRARLRFHSLLETRFDDLKTDAKEGIGANFDIAIVPRFPAVPLVDQFRLIEEASAVNIPWRRVGFPRNAQSTVSQHESIVWLRPGSNFSILEASIWGSVFFASEIEQHRPSPELGFKGIHLAQFIGNVFAFVRYASELLGRLSYAGTLRADVRMRQMRGVKWISVENNFPVNGPASELDDAIQIANDIDSRLLYDDPDRAALEVLRPIFSATNWAPLVKPQAIDRLVEAAYDFNLWGKPSGETMKTGGAGR